MAYRREARIDTNPPQSGRSLLPLCGKRLSHLIDSWGVDFGRRPTFFGSSPISGERRSDLEEEIGVIAVALGHALDDLDLVVDALDEVGAERPSAVREDAGQIATGAAGEGLERCTWRGYTTASRSVWRSWCR
jgi:hypothetical protein